LLTNKTTPARDCKMTTANPENSPPRPLAASPGRTSVCAVARTAEIGFCTTPHQRVAAAQNSNTLSPNDLARCEFCFPGVNQAQNPPRPHFALTPLPNFSYAANRKTEFIPFATNRTTEFIPFAANRKTEFIPFLTTERNSFRSRQSNGISSVLRDL
jgi:hypothetical protein